MLKKLYSYTLVTSQFVLIGILLFHSKSIFSSFLALFIFMCGAIIGIYALWTNNLKNINIIPEIKEDAVLITTGAYTYIRHPMYFSVLVMMLGVVVLEWSLFKTLLYVLLTMVLLLKAKKEEMLWIEKSEAYKDYRKKTKSIIPFVV